MLPEPANADSRSWDGFQLGEVQTIRSLLLAGVVVSVATILPATAGPGAAGHAHGDFSAGEPGNSKKPARVVVVAMQEGAGTMKCFPDRIEVKRGEQIRFMLTNAGALDHEFVLASKEENEKHAEEMKKKPDMEHDDPNARRLKPKAKNEIVWRFTKVGTFEFGCLIPGHRKAGMTGTIIVK
jgi:uncharacterized cupredoxin-like copper-binding protein